MLPSLLVVYPKSATFAIKADKVVSPLKYPVGALATTAMYFAAVVVFTVLVPDVLGDGSS